MVEDGKSLWCGRDDVRLAGLFGGHRPMKSRARYCGNHNQGADPPE